MPWKVRLYDEHGRHDLALEGERTVFNNDGPGLESIFDGRTLNGWRGQDMSFWSIEDGAITGTITSQHSPRMNQYLIWQRKIVQDFELQLEFRFTACAGRNENGGFQFRSRRLPNGDVAGYGSGVVQGHIRVEASPAQLGRPGSPSASIRRRTDCDLAEGLERRLV